MQSREVAEWQSDRVAKVVFWVALVAESSTPAVTPRSSARLRPLREHLVSGLSALANPTPAPPLGGGVEGMAYWRAFGSLNSCILSGSRVFGWL